MDEIQKVKDSMREEIGSVKNKINKTLETLLALVRREDEIRVTATIRNDTPVQKPTSPLRPTSPIPNPVIYGIPPSSPLSNTNTII